MLLELKVSNFAIIENIHIHFKKGLNILSGETGAGKSVLLKSLSLLMGQKGSAESIRTGAAQATVEGSFDLKNRGDIKAKLHELGIESEDNLLIVRRVLAADKFRVYINGVLSTINNLRDVVSPLIEVAGQAAPLIEMTGQHENRNLLSKSYHLDMLDQYCNLWSERQKFTDKYQAWNHINNEIKHLEGTAGNQAQRLDFLIYQKNEISDLDLSPGEDQELEQKIKQLKGSSRITGFVDAADAALASDEDSAVNRLRSIIQRSSEIVSTVPDLAEKVGSLEQAKALIEDCVYDLNMYLKKIDLDPAQLEKMEHRLSQIRKLQKKYGPSVDEIIQALVEIENEISLLQNFDQRLEELRTQSAKLVKELAPMASQLHKARAKGSTELAAAVNKELLDLNMKGVTFHVSAIEIADFNSSGGSEVEFMSQTSPNDPPRPLAKFASGGELSRILLSLKKVVGSSTQPRTYLFDEVDTGVSGPTAEKVGRKLRSIATKQQVICVTHLPQVAAAGDVHFFIQKSNDSKSVSMEVSELSKDERVKEIARLISGEKISKTSIAHAKELLQLEQ